jgi:hypothetical protein
MVKAAFLSKCLGLDALPLYCTTGLPTQRAETHNFCYIKSVFLHPKIHDRRLHDLFFWQTGLHRAYFLHQNHRPFLCPHRHLRGITRLASHWCRQPGCLGGNFALFNLLFLFYTLNFRTLLIQVDQEALRLNFGVFTWRVPRGNIAACRLDDDLPILMRYGGAGIHFMLVHGRYRASFNFLEYPRVVVELQEKVGPVRDISFTTRHPEQVTRLLRGAAPKEV